MVDIVSVAVRSRMMSGIRAKNTAPERLVRSELHQLGFRFRLHVRELPGTPDIVLPRWNTAILVHGCFWHGHGCRLFRLPATRTQFWEDKIKRNLEVDKRTVASLKQLGWRVLVIYECALRGPERRSMTAFRNRINRWIVSPRTFGEIRGTRSVIRRKERNLRSEKMSND